jgi:hypothetical protein
MGIDPGMGGQYAASMQSFATLTSLYLDPAKKSIDLRLVTTLH